MQMASGRLEQGHEMGSSSDLKCALHNHHDQMELFSAFFTYCWANYHSSSKELKYGISIGHSQGTSAHEHNQNEKEKIEILI